jgi:hypothetical protein
MATLKIALHQTDQIIFKLLGISCSEAAINLSNSGHKLVQK